MFDNKGDKGPPCGVPSSTGLTNPPSITPARRKARIQFQQSLVADSLCQFRHQFVVIDSVEELL